MNIGSLMTSTGAGLRQLDARRQHVEGQVAFRQVGRRQVVEAQVVRQVFLQRGVALRDVLVDAGGSPNTP